MDASWQPDPTGRHQYRWWDGAGWTDSVADNGQSGLDPLSGTAAPATVIGGSPQANPFPSAQSPGGAAPYQPSGGGSPPPTYGSAPVTPPSSKKGIWIALAVVGVAALGVVGFLIFGGGGGDSGGGSGVGTATYELTDDVRFVTRTIAVKKGEAVRVRVEPPGGMDTRSALVVSREDASDEASAALVFATEFYSDSSVNDILSEEFTDGDELFSDDFASEFARTFGNVLGDDGGTGEPDSGIIVALSDITYTLVISAYDDGDNGTITVIVERYTGDNFSDLDALTDVSSDDPFFSDTDFFSDTEPYSGS